VHYVDGNNNQAFQCGFIQNLVHRKLGGQIVMQLIMLFAWVLLYIGISSLPYSLRNLLVAEELVA